MYRRQQQHCSSVQHQRHDQDEPAHGLFVADTQCARPATTGAHLDQREGIELPVNSRQGEAVSSIVEAQFA